MPRGKTEQAENIIPKLREVELDVGRGKTVAEGNFRARRSGGRRSVFFDVCSVTAA